MPAHYAHAEMAERGAIARYKERIKLPLTPDSYSVKHVFSTLLHFGSYSKTDRHYRIVDLFHQYGRYICTRDTELEAKAFVDNMIDSINNATL